MSRFLLNLTWADAPHISEEDKKEILAGCMPHERDAVSKGIPSMGSGLIYPVPEEDIICEPFRLPPHWPRAYALDVGWHKTAAIFGAYDKKEDTWYLYSEYYRGYAEPSIHADAIKKRGLWMQGVIDPAARGRSTSDGKTMMGLYTGYGLTLYTANNSVETGLLEVYQRLSTGRLKVFKYLQNWLREFRTYRYADQGRVAMKQDDHLMDTTRYLMLSGQKVLQYEPSEDSGQEQYYYSGRSGSGNCTGY